jgi:hypothetical protein
MGININEQIRNLERQNYVTKPQNRAVYLNPFLLKSKTQLYSNIANSGGFGDTETKPIIGDDKKEDDDTEKAKSDDKPDDEPDKNNVSESDREFAKIIKDMVAIPKNKRTVITGFSRTVSLGNDEATIYKSQRGSDKKIILWGVSGDESDKDRFKRAEQKYLEIRKLRGYRDAKIIMGGAGYGNAIGLDILKKYDDKNIVFVGFNAIAHPDYNKDDRYHNTVKKWGKQSLSQILNNMGHPSTWSKEEIAFYKNQLKRNPDQKALDRFNKENNMGRHDLANTIKIHEYLKTENFTKDQIAKQMVEIHTNPELFNSILNQVEEKATLREFHEIDKKAYDQPDEIKYSLQVAASDEAYKDIKDRHIEGYTVDKELTTYETTVYVSDKQPNGLSKIIIGFRGTTGMTNLYDMMTDASLFLKMGIPGFMEEIYGAYSPADYRQRDALTLYTKIKQKYLYNSVHLSGHSLGGSLVKHVLANNPHDKRLVGYGFNAAPDQKFYKQRKNILNNNKYDFRYKPYLTYNEDDNLHDKIGRISELDHDNLRRIKSDEGSWFNPVALHAMENFKLKNKLRDRKKHSKS